MNGMRGTTATRLSTVAAGFCVLSAVASPTLLSAQQGQTQQAPATTRPAQPGAQGQAQAGAPQPATTVYSGMRGRRLGPQGFSVVLVLGDLQGTSTADDVPIAARKALTDMREFLPYKSYRLLDAAWLMCCGEQRDSASQMLRGPDEQEYDLRLTTSRAEGARVSVRFTLIGSAAAEAAAEAAGAANRTTARRLADLQDKRERLETQLKEARRKVEVGVAPAADVQKLEVELRAMQRQIEDLSARSSGARSNARTAVERGARTAVIDTSFSMDVGETVVVGTSRLKGGTKALIALLTAVPPRSGAR
ncbi:MAG TPA: hypothetical protein VFJ02_01345 [Vicinamibacterales bacterium]|nr:hypothetical protein [Vicinamibacterales bacterium]